MSAKAPSTRNVTSVFRSANEHQIREGLAWYSEAHNFCAALADAHGLPVATVAGIMAALSPNNSWVRNVALTRDLIVAGGLTSGYFAPMLAKANAILAGTDPLDVLTSDKIRNFYLCILADGETDAVCVDRHAMDVALNTRHTNDNRPKLTPRQYAAIADSYRRAAKILGYTAAQVQAVTWVAWRDRYWSAGAWDPKEL